MTRLIAFGDSIFAGWDGKENLPPSERIPEIIGQAMGWEVTNTAISGAKFDDRDSGFPAMVKSHSAAGYDYALVNYGVNDWCFPSGDLDYVKQRVEAGLDTLKQEAPNIRILLELPTEDFRNGSTSLFDINSQGWSQFQLDSMLVQIAKDKGIDYYDWRPDPIITYENASTTLGDGNTGVHPTAETGRKIADRLIAKFKEMAVVAPTPTPTPVAPKPIDPIKTISISRLPNIFAIADNVDAGINATVSKINELYKRLAHVEGIINVTTVSNGRSSPGNAPNRSLRNYTILSFQDIESPINDLVQRFNFYWVREWKMGKETNQISLQRPENLVLDQSYLDVINGNWKAIEDKLNELVSYINHLTGGGN